MQYLKANFNLILNYIFKELNNLSKLSFGKVRVKCQSLCSKALESAAIHAFKHCFFLVKQGTVPSLTVSRKPLPGEENNYHP